MTLRRHQQDWEELAQQDALWAILSTPGKEHGGWDLDEFLATGELEVAAVMQQAERLQRPRRRERALDFGCGYGRLSRAMSSRFSSTIGVDISEEMVLAARRVNADIPGLDFAVNVADDLTLFGAAEFDFVYSSIVLQHVPTAGLIERYVGEFVRVLKPGGLIVFQLPSAIPLRYRLQPRRRAWAAFRRLGVDPGFLRTRLGLHPIRMTSVPEPRVTRVLEDAGARLLRVDRGAIEPFGIQSNTYWATRE